VQAAPGLGYSYRWDADGDGTFDTDQFGAFGQVTLTLEEGASREVHLEVRNAFGRVRSGSFSVSRPRRDAAIPTALADPRTAPRGLPQLPARAIQRALPAGGSAPAGSAAAVPGGTLGGVQ
jgi:hypothetical protein